MKKKNILFVSQEVDNKKVCGVGVLGTLYGKTLAKSSKYNIKHVYTNDLQKLHSYYLTYKPELILFNFSLATMSWIISNDLVRHMPSKYALIFHDSNQEIADNFSPQKWFGFQYMIAADPTLKVAESSNFFTTTRLMPSYIPKKEYQTSEIPIIGFQGQLVPEKGLDQLVAQVQNEFDEAIIRLHCPNYKYGSGQSVWDETLRTSASIIKKPGIKIVIRKNAVDEQGLIDFMSQNTINCYFYKSQDGAGLASALDFALASKRPMCITKSYMFRNYWDTPEILIENTTIKNVIELGTKPLEKFYEDYSEKNFIADYERVISTILNN